MLIWAFFAILLKSTVAARKSFAYAHVFRLSRRRWPKSHKIAQIVDFGNSPVLGWILGRFPVLSGFWLILADSPVLSGFWVILQKLVDFSNFCDFAGVERRGSKIMCICTCFSPVEAAMAKIAQNIKNH